MHSSIGTLYRIILSYPCYQEIRILQQLRDKYVNHKRQNLHWKFPFSDSGNNYKYSNVNVCMQPFTSDALPYKKVFFLRTGLLAGTQP